MRRAHRRREIYSGELALGTAVDLAELAVRRGAHVRTIDSEGNPIADTREPGAMLWLEIGDRALLAPVDLESDAIAVVEVTRVYADGATLEVFRTCGELAPGDVYVMRGPAPKESRPVIRRAVVREAERPGAAITELVRAKRLEITNKLGGLVHQTKTSAERGGGSQ